MWEEFKEIGVKGYIYIVSIIAVMALLSFSASIMSLLSKKIRENKLKKLKCKGFTKGFNVETYIVKSDKLAGAKLKSLGYRVEFKYHFDKKSITKTETVRYDQSNYSKSEIDQWFNRNRDSIPIRYDCENPYKAMLEIDGHQIQ